MKDHPSTVFLPVWLLPVAEQIIARSRHERGRQRTVVERRDTSYQQAAYSNPQFLPWS